MCQISKDFPGRVWVWGPTGGKGNLIILNSYPSSSKNDPEKEENYCPNHFSKVSSSPEVRPGGGEGGSVVITPPVADDEDTDLEGWVQFVRIVCIKHYIIPSLFWSQWGDYIIWCAKGLIEYVVIFLKMLLSVGCRYFKLIFFCWRNIKHRVHHNALHNRA